MKAAFKSNEEVKITRRVFEQDNGWVELKNNKLHASYDGILLSLSNIDEFVVSVKELDNAMVQVSFMVKNHLGRMVLPFRFNGIPGEHIVATYNGEPLDLTEEKKTTQTSAAARKALDKDA